MACHKKVKVPEDQSTRNMAAAYARDLLTVWEGARWSRASALERATGEFRQVEAVVNSSCSEVETAPVVDIHWLTALAIQHPDVLYSHGGIIKPGTPTNPRGSRWTLYCNSQSWTKWHKITNETCSKCWILTPDPKNGWFLIYYQAPSFSLLPILPSIQCPCSNTKTWTELGSAAYTRGS